MTEKLHKKRSFAAREISAPVTLSRAVGQELGVARGRQEGRTIPAIGAYEQVTMGCDKPSLNFAHATIKFRARDNADRMDPRGR